MTDIRPTPPRLRRRYRGLLLAYPGAYRRRHGAEILTTLMEAAGPGREWPTAAEVRDIVAGGLRQRFRLPVGRLMMFAAILSALTLGGIGAAVGSAIGWTTAQRPPTDATVDELTELAMGGPFRHDVERRPDPLGVRSQTTASVVATGWSAAEAQARLEAAGWRVSPVEAGRTESTFEGVDGAATIPVDATHIVAERGDLVLDLSVTTFRGGPSGINGTSLASLGLVPAEPVSVLPVTVAGGLLGLLAGWLLAGRTGYRLRRLEPWSRALITSLAVVAMLLLAPSTLTAWYLAVQAIAFAAELQPVYLAYVHDFAARWIAGAGSALTVIVVALSVAVRPRPAPDPLGESGL